MKTKKFKKNRKNNNKTLRKKSKKMVGGIRTADSAKLDALLIYLKVPYRFSDGTLACAYELNNNNIANAKNEGRGFIKPKTSKYCEESSFLRDVTDNSDKQENFFPRDVSIHSTNTALSDLTEK